MKKCKEDKDVVAKLSATKGKLSYIVLLSNEVMSGQKLQAKLV